MKSIISMKNQKYIWGIIGAGILAYSIIMISLFNISGATVLKFLAFHVLSILLPGFAVFSLTGIKLSRTGAFCTSYSLGYTLLVLEYFFSELFDRKVSFTAVTLLVIAASLFILIKKYRKEKTLIAIKETGKEKLELLVLALFVVLNIFAYAANHLGTDVVPVFGAHRDMQYWVNNTAALKIAWPADNLFMAGNPLNYHYFSNIPIAFLSEVYKIDVFTMSFPLYGLTKAIVIVGAVQFLLDSVSDDKRITLLGYILLIFSTGAETISVVTLVHHTLLTPFGFDIGYAYGIFFIGFMVRQWKNNQFDIKIYMGMLLAWGMCVGAKAPVASVLILFAALICFYWLVHKKWSLAFGYGFSILGAFLVICRYCVGLFSVVSGDSAWSLQLYGRKHFTYMGDAEPWDLIGRCLVIKGRNNPIMGLLARTLCLNPVLILGVIVAFIWIIYLIYKKKIDGSEVYMQGSFLLTALFGIILWHMVYAGGSSEMYFAMASFIPMTVICLLALDLYFNTHKNETYFELTAIKKSLVIVFILLLHLGVFRFSWSAGNGVGALRDANNGFWNFYNVTHGFDYSERVPLGIRNTDVDALAWIRDNSGSDALVMTDKAVMTDNTGYYIYGIFCERQQYIEGTNMLTGAAVGIQEEIKRRMALVSSVYNNENGALDRAIEEGIDYIVQTLDITPGFEYNTNHLDLVASTATMNIFKVKK